MPSINELFSAPGSEAEDDFELDMDKLMEGVDQSMKESTRFSSPGDEEAPSPAEEAPAAEASPSPEPPEEPTHTSVEEPAASHGGATGQEEETPGGSAPPPQAATDPLGLLFAEAAQDPIKRDRLLQALQEPKAEVETAQMPEEFAEDSVAAKLWRDNQETKELVTRIAAGQRETAEAMERQRAVEAADRAGQEFAARYAGKLDGDDVVRIAQMAGNSGLAARLATGNDDIKGAYLQALESTLWTDERFRTKVMEPGAPAEPTVADVDKAEAPKRKRKLTALSSSASPVSAPATPKSALETRTDGRLTPQSRFSLVQEMATKLNRSNNEGGY